jgi:hypothetical protein
MELKSALILLALQDLRAKVGGNNTTSLNCDGSRLTNAVYAQDLRAKVGGDNTTPLIVMVVGAGRGPLVRASLRASERSGIAVFVYALDKNPNAGAQLAWVWYKSTNTDGVLVPQYKC